ncbi:hypothetical protein WT55_27995 [Burkholderia pseudomultivorans]|nr:hypothetical protein WT55_27995 [Burkholderia pseudomultivorans]
MPCADPTYLMLIGSIRCHHSFIDQLKCALKLLGIAITKPTLHHFLDEGVIPPARNQTAAFVTIRGDTKCLAG